MPKLQGATVSNQVVRGRKRKRTEPDVPEDETNAPDDVATNDDSVHDASQPATSTSVPTKTHDGGQKPRRTPKKGDKPALKRNVNTVARFTHKAGPNPQGTQSCLYLLLHSEAISYNIRDHQECRRGKHKARAYH